MEGLSVSEFGLAGTFYYRRALIHLQVFNMAECLLADFVIFFSFKLCFDWFLLHRGKFD